MSESSNLNLDLNLDFNKCALVTYVKDQKEVKEVICPRLSKPVDPLQDYKKVWFLSTKLDEIRRYVDPNVTATNIPSEEDGYYQPC